MTRYDESARARLAEVSSRGEAALLSGDAARRDAWMRELAAAEKAVFNAEHRPVVYQDVKLASACACNGALHPKCGVPSAGDGVPGG